LKTAALGAELTTAAVADYWRLVGRH